MRRPPNETPPLVQKGGASKRDLVGAEIKSEDNPSRRRSQARVWVTSHVIDQFIERSETPGLTREGAFREIQSPRLVAAAEKARQGRSTWYDLWGRFGYVFAKEGIDVRIVTVLYRYSQDRGAA